MTITCQPMDATSGAPAYSAQNERQNMSALFGGGGGVALAARSGFRVGTPSNILTATSTTWTLGPSSAVISPGNATAQGSYRWATDTNVTGTVTASDATYARKDIVYIQVNDSSSGDGSGALTANVLYAAGTPSATPVAPDLTGTRARSFLVGTITVPQTGGGSPTVVRNPAVFVAAGAPQPVFSQSERDAMTAYDGLDVKRMDLPGRPIDTYNGTAWQLPPQGQIATATYPSGTGNIAYNFLAIIADVTTPSIPAGRKLRITLETDANMSAGSGICAIGLQQGGTTGNNDGAGLRNCAVSYQSATSTQSSDLTYHFTTASAGPQRFYALSTAVLPSGATVNYPGGGRRITVYDDGAA